MESELDNIFLFKQNSEECPLETNEYQSSPQCIKSMQDTQPTEGRLNQCPNAGNVHFKSEILALRAENERLNAQLTTKIEEINLMKASQKHLFSTRMRKGDSASKLDSGRKKGAIREESEENSNRTLVERMVSLKLDKYKKKYSQLKQLLPQLRKREKLVQRLKSKNRSLNALNKSVLKSLMAGRSKEPMVLASEKPEAGLSEICAPQKTIVCQQIAEIHSNTVKILESIGYMKDRSKALIPRTPTTNFLEEDKAADRRHPTDNAIIGKRSVYESNSMSSFDTEEYKLELHKLIEDKKLEIEGDHPAKALISYGASDEEESSLSLDLADKHSLLKQLQQRDDLLTSEAKDEPLRANHSAVSNQVKQSSLTAQESSPMRVKVALAPSNELLPSISLSKPPSFLTNSTKPLEREKPFTQPPNQAISLYRELIKKPITPESRTRYFDILRAWKESEPCKPESSSREKSLDVLLLRHSQSKAYDLKSLIGLRQESGTEQDLIQKFVAQNVLYLMHTNLEWKENYSQEEQELISFLTDYESRNPFLSDKFQKLKDIISKNWQKQQTTKSLPSKSPSVATHYALLKIVFNHLMFYLEQKIEYINTEDYFNSSILAKKISFKELQNSAAFVIKKILTDITEVRWLQGLDDLLVATHDLFLFGEVQKMNFNKAYYEALQGFFANIKYRNTSQQLIACLVLVQLNTVL
jgi:hypothetical protein